MPETFKDKRRCLHCGEPIADQKHAHMKFCAREVLPDGSIKSCKDDYHSLRRKLAYEPFKRIAEYHRRSYLAIGELYKRTKGTVTIDELNRLGIFLSRAVEYNIEDGLCNAYFVKFLIMQVSKTEFKIKVHERQY